MLKGARLEKTNQNVKIWGVRGDKVPILGQKAFISYFLGNKK